MLLRGPAAHFPAAGGSSSLSSRSHPALCGSCSLAGSPGGSSTRSVIHRNGKFRGKSAQEIIFLFFKIIQQTKNCHLPAVRWWTWWPGKAWCTCNSYTGDVLPALNISGFLHCKTSKNMTNHRLHFYLENNNLQWLWLWPLVIKSTRWHNSKLKFSAIILWLRIQFIHVFRKKYADIGALDHFYWLVWLRLWYDVW